MLILTLTNMELHQLFLVPTSELHRVLQRLDQEDFKWKQTHGGVSISRYLEAAITRDYGDMTPVLDIEVTVGKDTGRLYKFVTLTTDKLLVINKDERSVESFEKFKEYFSL